MRYVKFAENKSLTEESLAKVFSNVSNKLHMAYNRNAIIRGTHDILWHCVEFLLAYSQLIAAKLATDRPAVSHTLVPTLQVFACHVVTMTGFKFVQYVLLANFKIAMGPETVHESQVQSSVSK